MRYILFLLVLNLSCTPKTDCSKQNERIQSDSIRLVNADSENKQLLFKNNQLRDSIQFVKTGIDTLKTQLFISNYKVEKVKYYLKIVNRDRTQEVFLRGWVTRAVE